MNPWVFLTATSTLLAAFLLAMFFREYLKRTRLSGKLEVLSKQMAHRLDVVESTGLKTRAGLESVLDQAAKIVDQNGGNFCVLYISLDNFGLLNDAFGHDHGEQLLMEVSQRLAAFTSLQASICQIAPGEFVLVFTGALAIGRRVATSVINVLKMPLNLQSMQTQLTCSIGIAVYPKHGTRSMLLGHASLAARRARMNGGGAFCLYESTMGVEIREETFLSNDLRRALELKQFELYFQPKIDAASMQVTAAEALLRWHHPQRGMISPEIFIPLAERFGMIGAIGNWVIEDACRTAAGWRQHGLRMRVAVNISGYQMREEDLVDRIETALAKNQIQPGRFTCEITESVAMDDTKVARHNFEKMRNAGFHVSIDDFGTGQSSLATLRRLPAAELKIDRAFVADLEETKDARLIVKSIVDLARALNLRIVAEGVETSGQRDILVGMGCHELQGYLFSKPMPAIELERLALDVRQPKPIEFRATLFAPTFMVDLD